MERDLVQKLVHPIQVVYEECLDEIIVWHYQEKDCAYIIEFKVHKPLREKDLSQTVANAHSQIDEKLYDAKLIAEKSGVYA